MKRSNGETNANSEQLAAARNPRRTGSNPVDDGDTRIAERPKTQISISPFRCRVWDLHPRCAEHLTEENCAPEIASFERDGQLVPVLGRRLPSGDDDTVELIYGARRLFVARLLNVPLVVDIYDLSDREALIAMDAENRVREDISAYERGASFDRWLREKRFESQKDLANALHLSKAQVSRLLKLARLPEVIVGAFESASDLCEVWGTELSRLAADPERVDSLMREARTVAQLQERPPPARIYERLRESARDVEDGRARHEIVRDDLGKELFRIRRSNGLVSFDIPLTVLTGHKLKSIEHSVTRLLQRAKHERRDLDDQTQLPRQVWFGTAGSSATRAPARVATAHHA